jgi:CHAT domain
LAATHGLVGGEIASLAEPALALTIPKEPTELDDGLLSASEVAQLKLNADWVVLSACNMAAGEKPGAEALSGLASAFFYSGARALLVLKEGCSCNCGMASDDLHDGISLLVAGPLTLFTAKDDAARLSRLG